MPKKYLNSMQQGFHWSGPRQPELATKLPILVVYCAFCIKLEFGSVGFWGERKTRELREKALSEKGENQQKTLCASDGGSSNQAHVTLVRGVHSHHYTTPAIIYTMDSILYFGQKIAPSDLWAIEACKT